MEDEFGLAAGHGAGDLPGVGVGDLQVEGQVLTRDLAEGFGAADVEGILVAELAVELRPPRDGLFEVEGIGDIHGGGAVGDAVVADLVQAEVDVAVLVGLPAAFLGGFGVVSDQGFLDEPVDLRPGAAVGVGGELPVHEPRSVGGQERVESAIRSAFHTGTCAVEDPGPGLREAVGELDDLADVVATRVQRPAQQGTELHDGEVGDQGCAGSGDREPGVQAAFGDGGRIHLVGHDVLAGPFRDRPEGGDLLLSDHCPPVTDLGEQLLDRVTATGRRPRPRGR